MKENDSILYRDRRWESPGAGPEPIAASEASKLASRTRTRTEYSDDSCSELSFSVYQDSIFLSNRSRSPLNLQDGSRTYGNEILSIAATRTSSFRGYGSHRGSTALQSTHVVNDSPSCVNYGISGSQRGSGKDKDDQERRPPKKQRTATGRGPQKLFACPYYKRDPIRYHNCRERLYSDIGRLK